MRHEQIIHIDLFSGIGGFALAADRVWGQGGVHHTFCDNDPFCQEVLKKHWPNAHIYEDIRTLTADAECFRYLYEQPQEQSTKSKLQALSEPLSDIPTPFILTGGFPCQPFSQAGRRRGTEDDRFLWPEMARVIGEFKPLWVIAENVRGLLTQGGGVVFERVCTDLESLGYEVQPIIIPAVAVNAPHRRDRVWFIAHATNADDRGNPRELPSKDEQQTQERQEKRFTKSGSANSNDTNARSWRHTRIPKRSGEGERSRPERHDAWNRHWLEVATRLCRVDDGLPRRMDRNPRLKALGNAIVPQVAEEIMRAIPL